MDTTTKKVLKLIKPNDVWKAILIDSQTQAGKTQKCFEILNQKLTSTLGTNNLVLFVTQSNSTASVNQIMQRATTSKQIMNIIPATNIYRSSKAPEDVIEGNYMLVDFWNSKNMANMITFVKQTKYDWNNILIVIDEVEQAGLHGVKSRLNFIRKVEKVAKYSITKVIFVTATTANLSKCILKVAEQDQLKFKEGVVSDIIANQVVEHHYATPHQNYVGASWFKETPNVWKRLVFPQREVDMTWDEYSKVKRDIVLEEISKLSYAAKELSLIVTSTRTDEHSKLGERLYRIGYNVIVELNGKQLKNFKVNYVNKSGGISTWMIPYNQIDYMADHGDLETYRNEKKKLIISGIMQKEDFTLSHILQASLFMMTSAETRIKKNITADEYHKLEAISNAISNLNKSTRRPNDYPDKPRVALVAGHLAGRGITIQNPAIDFTCTSFCFTESKDNHQRGATNTQRFGRACGMLADVFARPDRQPILIATDGIIKDAIANEMVVIAKAEEFPNGSIIALKDLINKADWERMMKHAKDTLEIEQERGAKAKEGTTIDGVSIIDLKRYFNSKDLLVGKMIRYLYELDGSTTFEQFKQAIKYTKNDDQFSNNLAAGRGLKCKYGKLWNYENGFIQLNSSIKRAINDWNQDTL